MDKSKLVLEKAYDSCKAKEPELTVIMIHGIASDSSSYDHAVEYFKGVKALDSVRFICFDLLGSGKSLKNDELEYDYKEQITALRNSILKLNLKTPVVLIGHSLGTFIVTRYANTYKDEVLKLILVSPPIYTEEDYKNPVFEAGMKVFRDAISLKNREILNEKPFINSMNKIVMNKSNYPNLVKLRTPAVLIYGIHDQIIASYNIPRLKKDNPGVFSIIKTEGRHGVSRDKYTKIAKILEEVLNDKTL